MKQFDDLVKVVARLRKECPWDKEQTLETLKPFLIEEVYEALQAIDENDRGKLAEELGDMLLHVVMLSVMIKEDSKHSIKTVVEGITKKMIHRHPHVFGKKKAKTAEDVLNRWEEAKREEVMKKLKGYEGLLGSIPKALPALQRAEKVQKRAARVGFDWDHVAGAWDKVYEELGEVRAEKTQPRLKEELGDLLFAIVNVARKLDIHAEEALQEANAKFGRRFSKIEKELVKKKLTLKEMDDLWNKAKAAEKS